jgi:hypothetical protein
LELDLWQQLAVAGETPEQSNVEQLGLGLDLILVQVPPQQQLVMAAKAVGVAQALPVGRSSTIEEEDV